MRTISGCTYVINALVFSPNHVMGEIGVDLNSFLFPEGRILKSIPQLFLWKISSCHLIAQFSWSRVLPKSELESSIQYCCNYLKDQYLAAKIKMEKQIWIFAFLASFVKGMIFYINIWSEVFEVFLENSTDIWVFFNVNSWIILIK